MTPVATLVVIAWIPLAIAIFSAVPPRRAAIIVLIAGWLFLPNIGFKLAGFPDVTKATLTMASVLIGALVFDPGRVLNFRPRPYDAAAALWCMCPFFTSLSNGLGTYDGLSGVLANFSTWGLPYLIGRIYFADLKGVHELALGIFIGGLLYVPLCLYEIRMSPTFHNLVYGFQPRDVMITLFQRPSVLAKTWRPFVFFDHGLALCIFMVTTSLLGVWMWRCGSVKQLRGVPMSYLVAPLFMTAVLCQGTGAIGLMVLGLSVLFFTKWSRWRIAVMLLALAVPSYYVVRISGAWQGEVITELVAVTISQQKAESLKQRLWQESMLIPRMLERPLFGWGKWGRSRLVNEVDQGDVRAAHVHSSGQISGVDAFWLITFGHYGLVGLLSYTLLLLLPVAMVIEQVPGPLWGNRVFGPVTGCAVLLIVVAIDYLLNGMYSPIPVIVAGGLTGLGGSKSLANQCNTETPALDGPGNVAIGERRRDSTKRRLWPR